jgi:hypothetical protein
VTADCIPVSVPATIVLLDIRLPGTPPEIKAGYGLLFANEDLEKNLTLNSYMT